MRWDGWWKNKSVSHHLIICLTIYHHFVWSRSSPSLPVINLGKEFQFLEDYYKRWGDGKWWDGRDGWWDGRDGWWDRCYKKRSPSFFSLTIYHVIICLIIYHLRFPFGLPSILELENLTIVGEMGDCEMR